MTRISKAKHRARIADRRARDLVAAKAMEEQRRKDIADARRVYRLTAPEDRERVMGRQQLQILASAGLFGLVRR